MTTRSRPRPRPGGGRTYTARLYATKPARRWPTWMTARHLPAVLIAVAEAGHLTAALVEWPAAPPRGLFHVLVAAALGLLSVMIYFGHSTVELVLGAVFLPAVVVAWLFGTYQDFPPLAATAVSTIELAAAGLLCVPRDRADGRSHRPPSPRQSAARR
jgi:hypothetical protein